jgi:hypothetical protein
MADIKTAMKGVVAPLATTMTSTKIVRDAWKLALKPEDDYIESQVALEKLEFASSVLGGLGAAAAPPAAGNVRSTSTITVPLADSSGGAASASLTVTLYGPGDVRGLDRAQIIRRYPAPGTNTAEETVLAHIEFDRPELPWAFSPAPQPGQPIKPWLTLIVVPRARVEWEPAAAGGLLPVLRVPLAQLPSLAQCHLWAHAQASRNIAADKPLDVRLSPAHAPVNLSRLVSPRVLRDGTAYVAAVVPTTDVGARGGLGLSGGTLDGAWGPGSEDPVRLPVYDSWEFTTGLDGSFKEIALRLQGVVAPYEVGRRFIDASVPGKPLRALMANEPGAKQVLRCALFSPTSPTPAQKVAENARWPGSITNDLRTELDRPGVIEKAAAPGQASSGAVPDLPIVGPRIYAKLHRGVAAVEGNEDADWFAQLNLRPTMRIVAGLGTRVVQKDQEALMQAAWAQLGEVQKANRAIALAQVAEQLATRLHARVNALDLGRLVQLTAPLSPRISLTQGTTLSAAIDASATPATVKLGAYRRMTRPGSPIVRRADAASRRQAGALVGGSNLRDFTRVYRNPPGVSDLSNEVLKSFDLTLVARTVNVQPNVVLSKLQSAVSALNSGGLAAHFTQPARWSNIDASFNLGRALAERWGARLLRPATIPALEEVRAQRVGPLMADLALARPAGGTSVAPALRDAAAGINDRLIERLGAGTVRPVIRPNEGGPVLRPIGGGPATRPDEATGPTRPDIDEPIKQPVGRAAARPGRVIVDRVDGLYAIDVRALTRIGDSPDARVKTEALGKLAQVAATRLSPTLESAANLPLERLRDATPQLADPGRLLAIDPVPRRKMLSLTSQQLVTALDPKTTVRKALDWRLQLAPDLAARWRTKPFIEPIMAAPRFNWPMYRALDEYDREWLVPGLSLLPKTDFVTVLSTNDEFMEAFLVGLSDELAHELLWRGYPTDRRGTYFHRFWSPRRDELTQPIHAFRKTRLGTHVAIGGAPPSGGGASGGARLGRAVIVVKSELVKRFPDLIIQAIRNQGTPRNPVFETAQSPQITAPVLFAEHLEPDIALVGVDLSVEELDGPGWWIVIAEHPSATRFELPGGVQAPPNSPNHLSSNRPHAAAFAEDRLHHPTRIAFEATDLIVTGA